MPPPAPEPTTTASQSTVTLSSSVCAAGSEYCYIVKTAPHFPCAQRKRDLQARHVAQQHGKCPFLNPKHIPEPQRNRTRAHLHHAQAVRKQQRGQLPGVAADGGRQVQRRAQQRRLARQLGRAGLLGARGVRACTGLGGSGLTLPRAAWARGVRACMRPPPHACVQGAQAQVDASSATAWQGSSWDTRGTRLPSRRAVLVTMIWDFVSITHLQIFGSICGTAHMTPHSQCRH